MLDFPAKCSAGQASGRQDASCFKGEMLAATLWNAARGGAAYQPCREGAKGPRACTEELLPP